MMKYVWAPLLQAGNNGELEFQAFLATPGPLISRAI